MPQSGGPVAAGGPASSWRVRTSARRAWRRHGQRRNARAGWHIVKELYDVGVLPGVVRRMAVGFKTDEVRRYLSFPDLQSR